MKKHFPFIDFRYVLTNPFKISSFFSYKDHLPWVLRSNVVYIFKCPSYRINYVGSTTRQPFMRTHEPSGSRFFTGLPLSGPIDPRFIDRRGGRLFFLTFLYYTSNLGVWHVLSCQLENYTEFFKTNFPSLISDLSPSHTLRNVSPRIFPSVEDVWNVSHRIFPSIEDV